MPDPGLHLVISLWSPPRVEYIQFLSPLCTGLFLHILRRQGTFCRSCVGLCFDGVLTKEIKNSIVEIVH